MPDTQEGKEEKPKKKSYFKIFFILFVVLGILLAGAGGAYWWFFLRNQGGNPLGEDQTLGQKGVQDGSTSKDDNTENVPSAFIPKAIVPPISLPSFTVNLSDASGDKYLRIAMDVEFSTQDAVKMVQSTSHRVRDAIILLLSSKTSSELMSAEGKVILKNEIAARLNQILGAPRVVRIYFTDFVVQ